MDGARRHWLFGLLLGAGVALRIVTSLAYHPALLRSDSVGYLRRSQALEPAELHPIGYQVFLRLFPIDVSLAPVTVFHHALGIAVAVVLYVLLGRLGVPRWLRALATAPVLLDSYQLNVEQHILSEAMFELLLVAACVALLWRRPPGLAASALAGLVLASAGLTRSVALVLVLPAALSLFLLSSSLSVRARLLRLGVLGGVFAVTVVGYMAWFHSNHGVWSVTTFGGRILYGRVVEMVDCSRLSVPAHERPLCVSGSSRERATANQLMWYRAHSPLRGLEAPAGKDKNEVAGDFAKRVIRDRPFVYLSVVGSDFLQAFHPVKTDRFDDVPLTRWKFPHEYRVPPAEHTWADAQPGELPREYAQVEASSTLAAFLRGYQRFAYTPGTVLGICLVAGLAAAAGLGRARRSSLRLPALLFAGLGLSLLIATVATTIFNWRYHLPQLVLLPPAGAAGLTALLGLRARRQEAGAGATPGTEPPRAHVPVTDSRA